MAGARGGRGVFVFRRAGVAEGGIGGGVFGVGGPGRGGVLAAGVPARLYVDPGDVPGAGRDGVSAAGDVVCADAAGDFDFIREHLLFFGVAGAGRVF